MSYFDICVPFWTETVPCTGKLPKEDAMSGYRVGDFLDLIC